MLATQFTPRVPVPENKHLMAGARLTGTSIHLVSQFPLAILVSAIPQSLEDIDIKYYAYKIYVYIYVYIYLLFHQFAFCSIIFYPSCLFLAVRGEPLWPVLQNKFGKEVQKTQDSPRSPPGNIGREGNREREQWGSRGVCLTCDLDIKHPEGKITAQELPTAGFIFHQNSDRRGVSRSFGTRRWPKATSAK